MTTPIATNFTRLTSADLLKLKRYLLDQVSRSMEGEPLNFGDQSDFIKQRLNERRLEEMISLAALERDAQDRFERIAERLERGCVFLLDRLESVPRV